MNTERYKTDTDVYAISYIDFIPRIESGTVIDFDSTGEELKYAIQLHRDSSTTFTANAKDVSIDFVDLIVRFKAAILECRRTLKRLTKAIGEQLESANNLIECEEENKRRDEPMEV